MDYLAQTHPVTHPKPPPPKAVSIERPKRLENCAHRGDNSRAMKSLLVSIVAAVLLVGCGNPDGALIQAVKDGNIKATKQAIADGADVNEISRNGETPLDLAIRLGGQTETADLLRKHGGKTGEELKAEGK